MNYIKEKNIKLQKKYNNSPRYVPTPYYYGTPDALNKKISLIDPPQQRMINVLVVRRDGPYKLLIKAICAMIRLKSEERKTTCRGYVEQTLEAFGLKHKDFEIADCPAINTSSWCLNRNILIDIIVDKKDKLTILMSVCQDNTIKFAVGVNTDELLHMEEL